MLQKLGVGNKQVIYWNSDGTELVNRIFEKYDMFYHRALLLNDPIITQLYGKAHIILLDEQRCMQQEGILIGFRCQKPGIYINTNAYAKQIAHRISSETGFIIKQTSTSTGSKSISHVMIDLGRRMDENQSYYLIKNTLLRLPFWI